jgi:hypothetical protein
MMAFKRMIGLALLSLCSGPATAQMSVDFGMVGSSVAGITTPVILNPCTTGSCNAPTPRGSRMVYATYQQTEALAREAVSGYVGRIARKNPGAAREMGARLAQHDYRKIYDGLIAGSGLRADDAIDTMTAYTVLGWSISNNVLQGVENDRLAAVRRQVAARFSRDPRLNAPGVPARMSEEMKLLYVTLHSGWQSSQREGNMRAFSDSVAAMLRAQSGQDLRSLRLTSDGFVGG